MLHDGGDDSGDCGGALWIRWSQGWELHFPEALVSWYTSGILRSIPPHAERREFYKFIVIPAQLEVRSNPLFPSFVLRLDGVIA